MRSHKIFWDLTRPTDLTRYIWHLIFELLLFTFYICHGMPWHAMTWHLTFDIWPFDIWHLTFDIWDFTLSLHINSLFWWNICKKHDNLRKKGLVESTTSATTSGISSGTSSATSTTSTSTLTSTTSTTGLNPLPALLTCLVLVSCRGWVKSLSVCPHSWDWDYFFSCHLTAL